MPSRGVSDAADAIRRISRKSARANSPDVQLGIVRNTSPLQVELTHGRYLLDEGDDLLLGQVVRATKLEVGDNLVLVDTPDNDWLAVSVLSDEAEVSLTGLSEPVDPSDAATKQYVDDNAGGGGGGSGVPVGGTTGQLLFKTSNVDGAVAWASLAATAPLQYDNATHTFSADIATSAETSASKLVAASDTRLSDARTPSGAAGGDLTGTYPNPALAAGSVTSTTILNGTIVDADVASANKDGTAATPSLRTLGTGSTQAAAGNDPRLSDSRTPTGAAGGDLTGTYPNPTLATGSVTSATILDGAIVNADINASAAIALSKLATDPLARANHTGTQTASTVSDFDTQVRTSRLDQMAAPTANVSLNSYKLTSVANPTAAQDAATKAYVDSASGGGSGRAFTWFFA